MTTTTTPIDENKLHDLLVKTVTELGAAASGPLVILGERLGLYRALATDGPMTPAELAEKTGTTERYIREWASNQAATGNIDYDSYTGTFAMNPEQCAIFADEDSPVLLTGGFLSTTSLWRDVDQLETAFRSGEGIAWGDHDGCLFCGVEKFFKPTYSGNLIDSWIPSLDGVSEKLVAGARVADIGCGHGASTILMAETYPASEFVGYDFHAPSIEAARERAAAAGLSNLRFEVATAKGIEEDGYDLVTFFDCLHDLGDPQGAVERARAMLKSDGTLMVVEPMAGNDLADNMNPVGRVFYAFSAQICTPCSLSQEVGTALGAQAGEGKLSEVIRKGGFGQVRRAAETPFNMILEARL